MGVIAIKGGINFANIKQYFEKFGKKTLKRKRAKTRFKKLSYSAKLETIKNILLMENFNELHRIIMKKIINDLPDENQKIFYNNYLYSDFENKDIETLKLAFFKAVYSVIYRENEYKIITKEDLLRFINSP